MQKQHKHNKIVHRKFSYTNLRKSLSFAKCDSNGKMENIVLQLVTKDCITVYGGYYERKQKSCSVHFKL